MKRTMMVVLAAALATMTASAAFAATPRIDQRQEKQQVRIVKGRASGALTRAEARKLRAGQRHVRRMEWRAKHDGRVTARERARIHKAQNRQSKQIYRFKHNRRHV